MNCDYIEFIIDKELCDLNKYINAERSNRYMAAKIKKDETEYCMVSVAKAKIVAITNPIDVEIEWHTNGRKDPDNVAYAIKFILDGMVKSKILKNDGIKQINSIKHTFVKDKKIYCAVKIKEINHG